MCNLSSVPSLMTKIFISRFLNCPPPTYKHNFYIHLLFEDFNKSFFEKFAFLFENWQTVENLTYNIKDKIADIF